MLSNKRIIKVINNSLEKYFPSVPIILDPVMVAKGGHPLLKNNAINYFVTISIMIYNLPKLKLFLLQKRYSEICKLIVL